MFYNQAKKDAIRKLENVEKRYKGLGEKANDLTLELYRLRKSASLAIDRVEKYINSLANSPKEFAKEIAEVKLSIREFNEAVRIETENSANNIKGAGVAVGGVNPEKPDVPLNKNDAFQKVQKRHVQEKR